MIPSVISAALGLLLGLAASRRPSALLMPRLRGLWLLLPALALAFLPYWLDRTAPELIWTEDRGLLLAIITVRQALLILLVLINLVPRHLPMPLRLRQLARRGWNRIRDWNHTWARLLPKRTHVRPAAQRVHAVEPERPATRWWHRLPLLGLLAAIGLQSAVLLGNSGYMPLTRDYLKSIDNPALVTGIRNGALLLHRLVSTDTELPWLALQYRLPLLERWFPSAFPWYGLAELMGAAALGLFLFSQFIGRLPGEAGRRRTRKAAGESLAPASPATAGESLAPASPATAGESFAPVSPATAGESLAPASPATESPAAVPDA